MRKRKILLIVGSITLGFFILMAIFFVIMNEGPLIVWSRQETAPVDIQLSDILLKTAEFLNEKPAFQPYYLAVSIDSPGTENLPSVKMGASKYVGIDSQYFLYSVSFEDGEFDSRIAIGEARSLAELTDAVIGDDSNFAENVTRCVAYLKDFLYKPDEPWHHLRLAYNMEMMTISYINQSDMEVIKRLDLSH